MCGWGRNAVGGGESQHAYTQQGITLEAREPALSPERECVCGGVGAGCLIMAVSPTLSQKGLTQANNQDEPCAHFPLESWKKYRAHGSAAWLKLVANA